MASSQNLTLGQKCGQPRRIDVNDSNDGLAKEFMKILKVISTADLEPGLPQSYHHRTVQRLCQIVLPEPTTGPSSPLLAVDRSLNLFSMVPSKGADKAFNSQFQTQVRHLCDSNSLDSTINKPDLLFVAATRVTATCGVTPSEDHDQDGTDKTSTTSTLKAEEEAFQTNLLNNEWCGTSLVIEVKMDQELQALAQLISHLITLYELGGTRLGLLWIRTRFSRVILSRSGRGNPQVLIETDNPMLHGIIKLERLAKTPSMFTLESLAFSVREDSLKEQKRAGNVLAKYLFKAAQSLARLTVGCHSIQEMKDNMTKLPKLGAGPTIEFTPEDNQPDDSRSDTGSHEGSDGQTGDDKVEKETVPGELREHPQSHSFMNEVCDPLTLAKFFHEPLWVALTTLKVELRWVSPKEFDSFLASS